MVERVSSMVIWTSFPAGCTDRTAGEKAEVCGTAYLLIALDHMHNKDI